MSRRARSTVLIAATVGAVVTGSVAAAPGQAAPPAASAASAQLDLASVPAIDWGPCPDNPAPLRCAKVRVPLDYDTPAGPKMVLDLLKSPASAPARRLGTLFVNPGGPGGSSTQFASFAAELLGATVAQRYDIVGIDPRGVGASAPMLCTPDAPPPPEPDVPFPATKAQADALWRLSVWGRTACTKDPNRIVAHMSTADVARDMDLIRRAVGDAKLNYYGISYGSQLGSVYASMFPERVGRFVVDAVLDPVQWTTGDSLPATKPFSTRLRSAKGASEALISALTECDRVGRAVCPFAGGARAKWDRLVAISRQGTLTAFGEEVTYPVLIGAVLGFLYANSYDGLDDVLQDIWLENTTRTSTVSREALARLRANAERVVTAPWLAPVAATPIGDAFVGVSCSDSRNPQNQADWWLAGRAQDRQYPWFGSLWTWVSSPCARWPMVTKEDAFFGPFGGRTANPILIVGNTHDPATPIHGARTVARLFPASRLLEYRGWGHGALGTSCVTAAFDRYYATGALPRPGATCRPDGGLFG